MMSILGSDCRLRALVVCTCIASCAGWSSREIGAQTFSYRPDRPRAVQSASVGFTSVDFQYDGDREPEPSFEFSGALYGLVYVRPNFHVTFGYGRENALDLRMLDASLTTWGEIRLAGSNGSRLYVPIALHSNYRRVAPEGQENSLVDAFNVTVIGLGMGLGFEARPFASVIIQARATPIIGLALHAFGDAAGSSRLIDANLQIHSPAVIGRIGFSLGYGLRTQVWNVRASSLFPVARNDLFDYTGTSHVVSIGVNW